MMNSNMVIMPTTYEELTHQAKRILQCKRLLPKEKQNYTVPEVESIIQIGQTYGLSPWQAVQAIMIVNGQASVWGDFLIGLAWASGKIKEIKEYNEGSLDKGTFVAICEVVRGSSVIIRKFSVADAKKANLWNRGPIWKTYPKRMLQMRARSWALRDGFGDVTKGLIAIEEAVDYKPLDDSKAPNLVEQEIIKTIAKDETKSDKEPVKATAEVQEPKNSDSVLNSMLVEQTILAFSKDGTEISRESAEESILEFLKTKKAPLEEISERALKNFNIYFKLLKSHMNSYEVKEAKDE